MHTCEFFHVFFLQFIFTLLVTFPDNIILPAFFLKYSKLMINQFKINMILSKLNIINQPGVKLYFLHKTAVFLHITTVYLYILPLYHLNT